MKQEKQGRKSNETYSEIGERIKKVLSLNFKDNTLDVDIYNALFGDKELLESSKRTKISDLRAGRGINLNILMLISEKFGVSLDWLVYGKESNNKPLEKKATHELMQAIIKRVMDFDGRENIEGFEPLPPQTDPRKFIPNRIENIEKYFHKALTIYNALSSSGVPSSMIKETLMEIVPVAVWFYSSGKGPVYMSQKEYRHLSGEGEK